MSITPIQIESLAKQPPRRRSIADLLGPLDQIAAQSPNLVVNPRDRFQVGRETYEVPGYRFIGPTGGDAPIRIGIFAVIHGDEPEGAHALVQLVKVLEARPELAAGYYLSLYPIYNPTGFEDNTRLSRRGKDLNREFWTGSREPEVRLLQAELISQSFHGIIALQADAASDGFYGIVRGATLTRHLIEPALQAAEAFLPRDSRPLIDGAQARNGIVREDFEGRLSAPPRVRPRPFEIILATPKAPPSYFKECAFVVALQSILVEYRHLMAFAQNI
jgi:murein peptide amidase A